MGVITHKMHACHVVAPGINQGILEGGLSKGMFPMLTEH